MIARLLAALWLACILFATPVLAQDAPAPRNPFTGAPQKESTAAPPVAPSLLARLGGEMFRLQGRMNKALAEQMRGIRDGGIGGALLAGVALAFLYGALHVAGPGHGKAVIVSYFLGRDATIRRGLWLGVQIAATHVVAAIVLVWAADAAVRHAFGGAPPAMRAMQAISYGAIVLVGLHMLWQAARGWRGQTVAVCGHDHSHDHRHHDHGSERARQGVLSFAVGLVPCTGATLVMLYALANGILYAGIVMVVAIGVGMAATMTLIGIATILARRATLTRLAGSEADGARWAAGLQLAAGAAICLLGALLFWQSLAGPGLAAS